MQLASPSFAFARLPPIAPNASPALEPTTAPVRTRARTRSRTLAGTLLRLAVHIRNEGLTVRQLLDVLGERGTLLLCLILATPFLVPFSLPGTSTPGGMLMAAVGLGMLRGRATWLPEGVLAHRLQGKTWARILVLNARVLRRGIGLDAGSAPVGRVHGAVMLLSALIFVLPIPIPLANMFPAYAVVCLSLGLLRRNVMLQGAAWVLCVASAAYLAMSWQVGVAGMQQLARLIG